MRAYRTGICGALAALLMAGAAGAQETALAQLKADLLNQTSATQVLTQWCARLHLADPPVIHAMRDRAANPAPGADIRALLAAGPDETIGYRKVKLMCGTHILSEADNWYLPARLTADMNRALEETDTPFGTVVRPLNFHRTTLEAAAPADASAVLRVKAVLRTEGDVPFSLVIENYSRDLAGD